MLEGRDWFAFPSASREALAFLGSVAPGEMPESYFSFLAWSNGGEGPLPVQPFNLCLDPAEQVSEAIRTSNQGREDLAGLIVIGGDGGGELVAFDVRGATPWPVLTIDMVAGIASAEIIATDFDSLVAIVGVDRGEYQAVR